MKRLEASHPAEASGLDSHDFSPCPLIALLDDTMVKSHEQFDNQSYSLQEKVRVRKEV